MVRLLLYINDFIIKQKHFNIFNIDYIYTIIYQLILKIFE